MNCTQNRKFVKRRKKSQDIKDNETELPWERTQLQVVPSAVTGKNRQPQVFSSTGSSLPLSTPP